jgi:hypothetical protein
MRRNTETLITGLMLVLGLNVLPVLGAGSYIYVAPNAVQAQELGIFTTVTLTNTTDYWFNPKICLIDPNGEIVGQLTPLLKSFGTWQKASVDIVPQDFSGSIWVISPHPIVSAAFIHQFNEDGGLSLLGNARLELIDNTHAEERLNPPE